MTDDKQTSAFRREDGKIAREVLIAVAGTVVASIILSAAASYITGRELLAGYGFRLDRLETGFDEHRKAEGHPTSVRRLDAITVAVDGLAKEAAALKSDTRAEIGRLRAETKDGFEALGREIKETRAAVSSLTIEIRSAIKRKE